MNIKFIKLINIKCISNSFLFNVCSIILKTGKKGFIMIFVKYGFSKSFRVTCFFMETIFYEKQEIGICT